MADNELGNEERKRTGIMGFVVVAILSAAVTFALAALLTNIFQHKQEAKNPYLKFVNVDNNTSDPAEWGKNWPREYDSYQRTVDITRTRYGGSEAMPAERIERDPWLKRIYAGYAFAIDFRDRRGHAYMLYDQEQTERVNKKPQAGACLHCHASITPTWRRIGAQSLGVPVRGDEFQWDAVMKGFDILSTKSYTEAHRELLLTGAPEQIQADPHANMGTPAATAPTTRAVLSTHPGKAHPVSCVDCHDPKNMELRVTRPGFVRGIQALAANLNAFTPHLPSIERWRKGDRKTPYDPNRDATRQEMRSFACAQCHVEYYCAPKEVLFFPWGEGLRVDDIETYYDKHKFPDGTPFMDYKHGETGAPIYKAQHPEFETWSQGVHARSGVACADCHMPYIREGAMKVSDHWVRSPMLQVNRSCQTCHPYPEADLHARVHTIQNRTHQLIGRSADAAVDMLDAIKAARQAGVKDADLKDAFDLQRKAQWRLDFVASENSMGFHASQETARVLAESIDYARRAQVAAQAKHLRMPDKPVELPPTVPVEGITPPDKAPPGPYKTEKGEEGQLAPPAADKAH